MGVSKEMRIKLGLAKSGAANRRELTKQGRSPYKRYVKKLKHKPGFVTPHLEPSACTRG